MMSLIEFVQPVDIGRIIIAAGFFCFLSMFTYILYRLYIKVVQYFDIAFDRSTKFSILEESFLDKIADKHGIDLNKELAKKKVLADTSKKSFRKKVEDQMYSEMFGQNKTK